MIDVIQLRKNLGWLGMLLPWIVLILSLIFENLAFPNSISATYHSLSCITPFMIILGSAGLLLITYRGYDKVDAIISTITGIFAILICIFPTNDGQYCEGAVIPETIGTFQLPNKLSDTLHMISAVSFFGLLAFNSYFLFTKSSGEMTPEKKERNIIYKVCGIGMVISLLLMFPLQGVPHIVWIVEAIALMFFGISWLTKSQCYSWLFKDKE